MAERVLRSIGRGELVDDPRFRTNEQRVAHGEELDAIIGAFVIERTQEENVAFFEAAEVTIGPVYDIPRFMEDRHVQARALLADYPDDDMGSFPMHAISSRFSGTPGAIRSPAPRLGQHSHDILAEGGFSAEERAAAITSGLVTAS
jgi:crotonobetainyl-CoA:carnitine CoA-transferase CaiB-like acyl-CoA transferase